MSRPERLYPRHWARGPPPPGASLKAAHDSRFIPAAFFGPLGKKGINGADLADALSAIGLPRPSGGSPAWRSLILRYAGAMPGCDGWELAGALRPLYVPAQHDGDGGQPDMPPAPPIEAPLPVDPPRAAHPRPAVYHPPGEAPVASVGTFVSGAQLRWLKRLAVAPADTAAAQVARMTPAQVAAARAVAGRFTADPTIARAAARLSV